MANGKEGRRAGARAERVSCQTYVLRKGAPDGDAMRPRPFPIPICPVLFSALPVQHLRWTKGLPSLPTNGRAA
jgi:hypothetical protein